MNQFHQREQQILDMTACLLLEHGETELTLDMVAQALDIAKGTIYKHFKSKNELYLSLLIKNQLHFLALLEAQSNTPFNQYVSYFVSYHLDQPERTVLFHFLEEKLSQQNGLQQQFATLYQIRRKTLKVLIPIAEAHLHYANSNLTPRDYLASLWALTYGAALLLNSSFYQRYLGSRHTLKQRYIQQALQIPSLAL